MTKINILNMKGFLQTVNACCGAVNLLQPDGSKENINKKYGIQNELLKRYIQNKNHLKLSLDIPAPKDYMSIVFFLIGSANN